jgi:hypothetical protein
LAELIADPSASKSAAAAVTTSGEIHMKDISGSYSLL